ncbi:MAG: hypothetical protein AAB250_01285, partial [Bdellovibrionota bacterium]
SMMMAFGSIAQGSTPEVFLKTAWQDPEVSEGNGVDYDPSRALSPFREVELFGSTDSRAKPAREVGVEMTVKPFAELRESWKAKSRQQGEFSRKLRLQQALQRRYLLLVEFFHTKKVLKFLRDHEDILDRNTKAQGVAIRYGKSNPQSLLKAQVALSNIQRELRYTTTHFEAIKAQIKQIMPEFKESTFGIKSFVTPETIADQRSLFKSTSPTNTSQATLEMQLAQMETEQRISIARQDAWLKAIDVSVEERDGEVTYKGTLKFKLPYLGDDLVANQSRTERLAKIGEKKRELHVAASERQIEGERLKLLLDSYDQINKTLASLSKVERSIVDPQAAIDVVVGIRAARSELMSLEKEILIAYVDLLYEQSILIQQPDVNHLSSSKVKI